MRNYETNCDRYILDKKKKRSESNNSISHFNLSFRFSDTNDQNFGVYVRSLVQLRSYLPRKRKFKLKNDKGHFDCSFLYQK